MAAMGEREQNSATVLKTAINLFYQSIGHNGPYNADCLKTSVTQSQVISLQPHYDFMISEKCVFICDTAAFARLESSVSTIPILAKSCAVPHVNMCTDSVSIEWLLMNSLSEHSVDPIQIPFSNVWFIMPHPFREIFEHVAALRGLFPVRTKVSVSAPNRSVGFSPAEEIALTMIIIYPADVFATWMSSKEASSVDRASLSSPLRFTSYIADERRVPAFDQGDDMSNVLHLGDHLVMMQIPQPWQQVISPLCQPTILGSNFSAECCHQSEITVKEEPYHDNVENDSVRLGLEDLQNAGTESFRRVELQKKFLPNVHKAKQHTSKLRNCGRPRTCKHFSVLLQCPKCSVTFKCGFQGQGMSYLMQHVYDSHPRLTSSCTIQIRQRYGDILREIGAGKQ